MRRNIIIVASMVAITFLVLILGGIVHFKAPSMQDFKSVAEASMDSSTMVKADGIKLRKSYGINVRDAEDYIYFAPKSTMDASEIIVIKFKNEEDAQKASSIIENKSKKLENQFRNYKPDQADILSRSYLKVNGKYLIFVSSKNSDSIRAQMEEIFR